MRYTISHVTTIDYTQPVAISHNVAHLAPRPCSHQKCLSASLDIEPPAAVRLSKGDFFGNPQLMFTIQERHDRLVVSSQLAVSVSARPSPRPAETPAWEKVRDEIARASDDERLDAYQFIFESPYISQQDAALGDALLAYARPSFPQDRPVLEAAVDLTRRIHEEFQYDPVATDLATPLSDVLAQRRGVCQDFAHLQIGCLRAMGLPARYISGYLRTIPPAGKPRLRGADASHAWLSTFVPGSGWIDIDPTNNCLPTTDHITLAWGRDFDDVSPLKGVVIGGGEQTVSVSVDVAPEDDTPSPKP